jgi:hypothetical protein
VFSSTYLASPLFDSTTENFSGGCGGEVVQGSLKAKFKNQKAGEASFLFKY